MTKRFSTKANVRWKGPGFGQIIAKVWQSISVHWKLIGGITLIYAILFFFFSKGLSAVNISLLKTSIDEGLDLASDSFGGRLLIAGLVFVSSGAQEGVGAAYMFFISIFTVLALIWALRHIWNDKKTNLREAFYKGTYPVIPFALLVLLAVAQLIPLALGAALLNMALSQDILISLPEIIGGYIVLLVLPLGASGWMLITTMQALMIVTIPDMSPLDAYRSAKQLVKNRRPYLVKQYLTAILAVVVLAVTILVAIIAFLPSLAVILGLIMSILLLPFFTVFIYTVYRSLVDGQK